MIDDKTARIIELEEQLRERNLAVAAMSKKRAEAYRRGVRDGIERVRHQIHEMRLHKSTNAEDTCDAALAAYEKEVGRE